jgi:predicted methyltransferase
MTDDDYDALSQRHLASIKRDMRISLEDAAVRATHKVMAGYETSAQRMKELAEQALESGQRDYWLERFAALVAAHERDRITKMLNYLDMKAQPYHNYYRHAAVEINRKEGEGENI